MSHKEIQYYRFPALLLIFSIGILSILGSGGGEIETSPDVSTPTNLRILSTNVTSVSLDWDYTGPVDVTTGFKVYRNGVNISHTAGTSYTDYNLIPNTYYCYTVTAYNFWGESGHSNRVCTTTPADTASPTPPGNFVAKNTYANEANLRWNRATDNAGVVGYRIYRNNQHIFTDTTTEATDSGLADNTNYCYKVTAYDSSGNESESSNQACVDTAWHEETLSADEDISGALDIAIDTDSKAHIIYVDETTLELKYATNIGGDWAINVIDSLQYPPTASASIALDSANKAHVSYYDNINSSLNYATNKTGIWTKEIVDSGVNSVGRGNSISLDANDHVHISYLSVNEVKYVNNISDSWSIETVDANGAIGSSISIDSQNIIHIAYISDITDTINHAKKISGLWVSEVVTDYFMGGGLDMDIDSNDNIHICNQKYITNKTGQWEVNEIDYLSVSSCSIAADDQNTIHISYSVTYSRVVYDPYYISYTYRDIRYGKLENDTWSTYTLNNSYASSTNSLSLDSNGATHIIYYELYELGLKYVTNQ